MRTFTPCSQMVYKWRTRYLGEIKTLLSLFILFFFFHQPIHAQLVGGPTVKANLGIDGDVYANTQLLGTTVPNTDDWFLNTTVYPGTGKNIIDQTQSAELRAAVLANLNDAFSLRMSVPQLTVVDGRLWVDAVYGRDNNSIGSSVDASIFSGSSNKNGDNPTTWALGTGSVPQKNDLIDVFGHLRFDGTDPSTSHLWGYAGSTTRSADGESHVDYEIYRTISYTSGSSSFTGTGPNEGHTAFSFGPTGLVSNPGDLIVSVDFAMGGTSPSANVRIWIAKTVWDNRNAPGGFNSLSDSKFTLSDEFDQGNGAVNYGYALIAPKPNVPQFIWAAVNTTGDVLGAPWGSIEGNSFQDNILQLQYSEFAIDATAIGLILPQGAPGEPCKSILGNLLVKTRSSTSFTAELKDFAGPYEFANTTLVRVNAGADQVLTCTNPTANLIATNIVPPNSSVLWTGPGGFSQTVTSSGSTANPITVSVAGTYTATVSAGPQGCFAADDVVVTENKTPPNVSAGADKVITCTTTSVTLDGSSTTAGATFAWTGPGGFTSSSATPSVTAAGTYTLTVTNPVNGCTATDAAVVTLNNTPPNVNAGADKVITCTTTSVTLDGSSTTAGVTFAWTGPGGFTSTSATPSVTVAGTYTLTVTAPNGCTATDAAVVTLNNTPPNVNAGADKVITCTTTSVTLDGSSTTAGVTFAWTGPGGFTSSSATPSVTAAGTYTLTVTNPANGCTATDVAVVTLNNTPPNVNAGADKVITCTTTSVTLDGSSTTAGVTFAWTGPGGFTSSSATPSVTAAGTYTLTVTNPANGCTATDVAVVTLNNTPPNVNAGPDKVITCTTTSVTLNGSSTTAGATFAWQGPGGFTSSSATPTVTVAGTYTLTVTNPVNGCTATDVALVTLDANAPNVNAGADKVITCTTTSVTLDGSSTTAGVTFAWTGPGGFTSSSATPTVTAAGTYTLTVTAPNGCTATDVALVTLNNTPPNVNAGADKVITCTTTSVTLDGSSTTAGVTFAWTGPGGFTSSSATPTVTAAGTYTLTVTNPANGCTATDAAVVTVNNTPPNVNAGPDKVITCTTTSVTLNGSSTTAGVTFAWTGPGGFTSSSATPTVTAAGTYTLTVTNPANGCTATDVALVTLDANAPNVNAGPDKVITCTTTSVTLNGSSTTAGVTFAWQGPGGFTSSSATPTVTVAGTYTLTVTATNGCTATDVALVTLNNTPPNVNAGADKVITCTTTSVTLDGSSTTAGVTFAWTGPGGFTSSSATPTVTAAGTYTLTVTNPANGCTATDVAVVTLNNTPPNANAGADKVITCTTTSVTLDGSSTTAGATFAWTGPGGFTSSSATPTVTAAGTYTLTVTNPANGCTATDVAVVTVNANAPNVNAGPDKVITCTTTSVTLNGSSTTAGVTFAWTGPGGFTSSSATPTVTVAGTYTLTVTNPANGCTATDVALVTVDNTPPNVNAGPDLQIACQSGSGMLNGSSTTPGATFAWTGPGGFTSTSATPTVTLAGTYTLTVTGPNGCTASDAAVVTKQPCVVFCSFTQGFWGNKNGLAMLPGLLTTPITIGRPGHSVIIPVGSAVTLNNIMPGGQSPKLLLAGNCSITQSCFSAYLTKQGRINNVLLSQTITLSLNVRLNGGILNSLPIQSGWLTTQNQSGDCISTSSVQMNQNVVNYLTYNGATATVADLLNLANDVLGGTLVPGTNVGTVANPRIVPSLDDINSAVDAINNAFDGCRTFVGYFACQKNCSNLNLPCNAVVSANMIRISEAGIAEQVKVKAFPNPFNDRIRFTIKSTRSGQGSLEVFNTLGQKVNTVFQGYIHAGSEQVVEYKVPSSNRQNMIYVMTLNGERVAGKLLNAKE